MRILRMSATFGKLEHASLELTPGLNILEAPNEWGKSTWCAFLTAMLYGIDTRAKTTKTALSDKERYAPWSGTPMEGRIDLEWEGREITVERRTKGRIPMGVFSAYETGTGIAVPELTAANCGEVLLGVERSVFLRSAFIRFQDLPVSQDEALRRRLNALVSTGDESGNGENFAKQLRDLKNKCRYHQSGLLPQCEGERSALEAAIREQESLENQTAMLETQLSALDTRRQQLENHLTALKYADAQAHHRRIAQSEAQCAQLQQQLEQAEALCNTLPAPDVLRQKLDALRELHSRWLAFHEEQSHLPQPPEPPVPPRVFQQLDGAGAMDTAREDGKTYAALTKKQPLLPISALVLLAAGTVLGCFYPLPGIGVGLVGLLLLVFSLISGRKRKKEAAALAERYPSPLPESWLALAEDYAAALQRHEQALSSIAQARKAFSTRQDTLKQSLADLTEGMAAWQAQANWENGLNTWKTAEDLRRELVHARDQLETLNTLVKPAEAPAFEDTLTLPMAETRQQLSALDQQKHAMQDRLSQHRGRIAAMGDIGQLKQKLDAVNARIRKLEDYDAALTIARQTLEQATAELQRRFAPRITQRAAQLMSRMTGGRYDRLRLSEELKLFAGAEAEETLREAQWRSDGTGDQLYLALRLAVAGELAPNAPLILDDALVRFDDDRLKLALGILREEAQHRQILLFTCHGREKALM